MLGNCPECRESIRVPQGAPEQQVRCPLCNGEYRLAQVWESLPPELELIGSTSREFGIDLNSAQGDESAVASGNHGNSASVTSRRKQTQNRNHPNVFGEILKVVLGGVVAIPVGVLCVWWFAGRAPFGIAESVGKYAPYLVPEKLRAGDLADEINGDPNNSAFRGGRSGKKEILSRDLKPSREFPDSGESKGVLGSNDLFDDVDLLNQGVPPRKQDQDKSKVFSESGSPGRLSGKGEDQDQRSEVGTQNAEGVINDDKAKKK